MGIRWFYESGFPMVDELLLTDGQRLLRRILECPDDDAPRLIYSDWLEEQGEDERARFIRLDVERNSRWPNFKSICQADREYLYPDHERLAEIEKQLFELAGYENGACKRCDWHEHLTHHGTQWSYERGLVSSVSLTCEVFVGGQCETCKGLGWPDFASYNARNFRRDFAPPCYKCRGTGRIEGVARELFSRHPILSIKLVDKKPADIANIKYGWFINDSSFIVDRPDVLPSQLKALYGVRSKTEELANTALSRACVAYGRSLVGLPMLDS